MTSLLDSLVALRTPVKEPDPAAPQATSAGAKRRAKAPDQVFTCRLAYALSARRAIEGADERTNRVRPLYAALLMDEGARRPVDAAITAHGYLESTHDRAAVRRLEFLRKVGYRRTYQQTAAGPSIHTLWAPGYFELEPPANLDLEDAEGHLEGPLVRLCSMPPLTDLRAGVASLADRQRWTDAAAWVRDLGLDGPGPGDPRSEVLGPAAAWWAAQVDRRVASPMLHDPRFYVLVLLSAARSSATNGLPLPTTWGGKFDRSKGACAQWAHGRYPSGEDWARPGASWGVSDGEHFLEHGLRARDFGLADPILTIARDGALRHVLARECRAFEQANRASPHGRRAAYEAAVKEADERRIEEVAAAAQAAKDAQAKGQGAKGKRRK